MLVAQGPAFGVGRGLGKNAAELDLAGAGRLAGGLAGASRSLSRDHGHARAIQFDVEHGRGWGADVRQFQLLGSLDFDLLAAGDVGAEGPGLAFDGFGGDVQPGWRSELFAALFERGFAAHQRHHPPHSRRIGSSFYVELGVAWALLPQGEDLQSSVLSTAEEHSCGGEGSQDEFKHEALRSTIGVRQICDGGNGGAPKARSK